MIKSGGWETVKKKFYNLNFEDGKLKLSVLTTLSLDLILTLANHLD
ncbi:hypothetical protein ALTERO38_60236 [Alteromonas sp. 38]|nr:hypothetical protein ALTER154_40557 [Alteromonas sp. 154]VXC13997.1 hypothetical protein ALTERO38_60236 [Alteromonas sp. 38]